VGRGARPRPVLRPVAETRPHRVALHIPRCGKQVPLVHHEGVETLLPEAASLALAEVDHASGSAMGLPQRVPQSKLVGGDQNEVEMIGHRAIGQHLCPAPAARASQPASIRRVLPIREERLLASTPRCVTRWGNPGATTLASLAASFCEPRPPGIRESILLAYPASGG